MSSGALDQTFASGPCPPTDSLVTDIELCLETACNTGEFDGKWFLHAYTRSRNLDADDKSVALSDDDNKELVLERVAVRQFLVDPLKVGTEKHQRISISPPLAICRGTYLGVCTSSGPLNLLSHTDGRAVGESILICSEETSNKHICVSKCKYADSLSG